MNVMIAMRLLSLPVAALALQACLGTGAGTSEHPVPLLTSPADARGANAYAGLSPEEARAQAVAEIRAKAQAHQAQQRSAPYPPVFVTHGPPMAIAHEQRTQRAIEAELGQVRRELERASDPDEIAELEERMAELQELGRNHERLSEERIRAISEESR
jgi:hypothetical protein